MTDAKHEAPAEGAGDLTPERVLSRICDVQKRHYGNATALHLAMLDLCIDGRAALALRARSSAPEARDGEAVAWYRNDTPSIIWVGREYPVHWEEGEGSPLFTHPAAPSADKLRIAVEALLHARSDLLGFACSRGSEYEGSAESVTEEIDKALAVLKAEGC